MTTRGGIVRIVVTYPDGALTGDAFRAVQRSRGAIRRAGYLADVELVPASTAAAADGSEGDVEALTATPTLGADLDALLERLAGTGRLLRGPEPPRSVAVHRGFQALGERARLPE